MGGRFLADVFIAIDDEVKFVCSDISFRQALYVLLSVYYIARINYPRGYSQVLGLLQQLVLNETLYGDKI